MKRVAMFVTNPCTHDARVMKEAKSLADHGYTVRVFALANSHYPEGVFEQDNYSVHRLKFANVFKRAQNGLWCAVRFVLTPFRITKNALVYVLRKVLLLPVLLLSSVLAAIAVLLLPLFPKQGARIRSTARHLAGREPTENNHTEDPDGLNLIQRLALTLRRKKVGTYVFLKANFSFSTRRTLQKVIGRGSGIFFRVVNLGWLVYRKVSSFFKKVRRQIISKTNRLIYVMLLPLHKLTTYYFFCRSAAKNAIEWQPQIVHAHDLNTLYAAKLVKDVTPVKVIYDSHELWIHRNRVNRKATLEKKLDSYVERWLIRYADGVITVCDSIADWLLNRYDTIPQPIIVRNMPHKLVEQTDHQDNLGLKERLGIPQDRFVMIYTGKITSGRGIEIGLNALADIPNLHFVMLGYGETGYVKAINDLICKLGISDRVSFCGAVPHTEVTQFILGADFALVYIEPICLSYEYALPNKLFESIQAGVPVLGSSLVEIEKLVLGRNIGLCFSSAHDLAKKIATVFDQSQLQLWRESINQCKSELCWEVEQDQLLNLYSTLDGEAQPILQSSF